ncbi:hypothetical protein HRbin36_01208 [bacterium HR36]|nr:hypothetical protein HRbin36_01208 [bacterium HR36]
MNGIGIGVGIVHANGITVSQREDKLAIFWHGLRAGYGVFGGQVGVDENAPYATTVSGDDELVEIDVELHVGDASIWEAFAIESPLPSLGIHVEGPAENAGIGAHINHVILPTWKAWFHNDGPRCHVRQGIANGSPSEGKESPATSTA